jgi:hypothetical protein
VAKCIAKEVIIMFLVSTWIGKIMKNISTAAVSVCMGEVRRLLDEGDVKLGWKKVKPGFPSGSARGDVTFGRRVHALRKYVAN